MRLVFHKFQSGTFGPELSIARQDIVAVEQKWSTQTARHHGLLHLRGGATLEVGEDYSLVVLEVYGPQKKEGRE